jgi:sugar/nucleoside kinase (ribokinase family)
VLEGVCVKTLPAARSTTFENIYENGHRRQKWLASSRNVSYSDIPPEWRQAPIVHFALIGQEVPPSLSTQFPGSLIGVTAQGWLRGRDAGNNVIYQPHPELEAWLSHIDVMVVSISDLFGDRDALNHILTSVKIGIETLGPDGCRIFYQGDVFHVPVERREEVDPTGAGDIFSAAFLIKYHQTRDFIEAAQFANACASLSVGAVGLAGVPKLSKVENCAARIYPCCDQV